MSKKMTRLRKKILFSPLYALVFAILLACAAKNACANATQLQIAQYIGGGEMATRQNYPNALAGLIAAASKCTGTALHADPLMLTSFTDPRLAQCPLLYINWDDRTDWDQLDLNEITALRQYLNNGGFVFIDAGIAASFLRQSFSMQQQHHSFAEWKERPEVTAFFQKVLPQQQFRKVYRNDPVFSGCFQGLPDTSLLPESVLDYTVTEKWPDGTYSAVAIRIDSHIAVLAMPVIAMGWARNPNGSWQTTIRLRVLEGGKAKLNESLSNAAVTGRQFEVTREDGAQDIVFCQNDAMPAWQKEPNNHWRVFRYYDSRQINDFTHVFYTRLGINIITAAIYGL